MKEELSLIKVKLAIGCAVIGVMLVISGLTALSIQRDAAEATAALVESNESDRTMLAIKANISQSLFPAHDYLIEKALIDKGPPFSIIVKSIRQDMERLAAAEAADHQEKALIDDALVQLDELESIQRQIFALTDEELGKEGPAMMDKMHEFQVAIIDNFDDFKLAEQTELEKLTADADARSRRAVALIVATAAIALAAAFFVAFTANEL